MNIFISYNRQNYALVESIVQKIKLLKRHLKIFIDQEDVEPGQNWTETTQQALDKSDVCIVFIGEQGIGKWQNAEVVTAMNKRSKGLRIIVVILPHGNREQTKKGVPWYLGDIQWIEFTSETDPDAFQRLVSCLFSLEEVNPYPFDPVPTDTIPYKGLDFFDVQDAPFFFGRTFDVNWVFYKKLRIGSITGHRFLAIVGDSGSGKSSFARAGILANIKAGRFAGSQHWMQLIFSPEYTPLLKLSSSLQSAGIISDAKKMEEDAKEDKYTLLRIAETYKKGIVLMIDQFEEVITQCKDSSQRDAFLNNLIEAAHSKSIVCIITLRSDFYAAFSAFPEFADLLETNNYTITNLDYNIAGEEWRRYMQSIIEKPALMSDVWFDPLLTNRIIEDSKAIYGILPALQLALVELWKKRNDKTRIELADYDSLASGKGIAGIIEAHANNTWSLLTINGSVLHLGNLIKAIFIRLVEITSNKEDVRKTVNKTQLVEELSLQFNQREIENTLNKLAGPETRLVRIKRDEISKDTYWVEVIHEVLIRQWDMLRKWIDERREAIKYRNNLEQYIDDENKLLTGKKLKTAERWININKDLTTKKINNFMEKSREGVRKRKYAITTTLAILMLFALVVRALYPVYKCKNCSLVKTLTNGNYDVDEIHKLTLHGTNQIEYLQCFIILDTVILSGNNLSQASIDSLPENLVKISIDGSFLYNTSLNFRKFSNLRFLSILSQGNLGSLNISNLKNLVKLEVSGLDSYTSLVGVGELKSLQSLNVSNLKNVSSLSGIENLKSLQDLTLSNLITLQSLAGIEGLKNLQNLNLSNLDSLSSLSGIEHLTSLQSLSLTGLRSLPGLKDLRGMQSLRKLNIDLHISNLQGIEDLGSLQALSLADLRITSLEDLRNLTGLKTLSISGLPITSLKGIETLNLLQDLSISYLSIDTLLGIENLKNLNKLTLADVGIYGLSSIILLKNLQHLSLLNLPNLSDLSGVENLNDLQHLSISNLPITSIKGIERLNHLHTLDLSSLPEINLADIERFQSLQSLRLSNLPHTNFTGIEKLINLKCLALNHIAEMNTDAVFIPSLTSLTNIDTLTIENIKVKNLDFISNQVRIKIIVYNNEVEFPQGENGFSFKAKQMKQTKFFNESFLGPVKDS